MAGQPVLAAAPDGHTLLFTNSGHPILGVLNMSLRFAMIGAAPAVVAVSPALGVGNLEEFVALARVRPGCGEVRKQRTLGDPDGAAGVSCRRADGCSANGWFRHFA
jgi:hypothetical protein